MNNNICATQTWGEVHEYFASKIEDQFSVEIAHLVKSLMKSELRNVFYPSHSLIGLILAQTPQFEWGTHVLMISPGDDLHFEYLDSYKTEKNWKRSCKYEEAFNLVEKFVEQLHLLVRYKNNVT